jgi:hypothetical protein
LVVTGGACDLLTELLDRAFEDAAATTTGHA